MIPRSLARYPFLRAAREFISRESPPLEKILTAPLFSDVRDRAARRVDGALADAAIPTPILLDEESVRDEMLSYPLARMLVSVVGDSFLVARYALAEAKSAGSRLEGEELDFVMNVARDVGMAHVYEKEHLPADIRGGMKGTVFSRETEVFVHFSDYLRGASSFTSPEWKMVNRELAGGYVALSKKNLVRLLEEMIRGKILAELPLPVTPFIEESFRDTASELTRKCEELKERFREDDFGEYSAERLPPCLAHLISQIQANINLSHEGRFFMAAFLFHIGLGMDNVVAVFSQSPDFDASLARYQLEHIRGDLSGTRYTPPGCGPLKTNGICNKPDSLCRQPWMNHPLTYYRVKGRNRDKEGKTEEEQGKEGAGAGEVGPEKPDVGSGREEG